MHYIMNPRDGRCCPVPALVWAKWFSKHDRRVSETFFDDGNVRVSTIFLGLDHASANGPPLIFETMVFNKPWDERGQWRYTTYKEAKAGHEDVCNRIRNGELFGSET